MQQEVECKRNHRELRTDRSSVCVSWHVHRFFLRVLLPGPDRPRGLFFSCIKGPALGGLQPLSPSFRFDSPGLISKLSSERATRRNKQAILLDLCARKELAASTTKPKLEEVIGGCLGATAGEIGGGETEEQRNKFLVLRLYEALNGGRDPTGVQSLLAPDLEWWFHGPPKRQHMMRILTGDSAGNAAFRFVPRSVTAFGSTVIAEGGDQGTTKGDVYWVHAWTVRPEDGVITQLREYFNTDLTVTRLAAAAAKQCVWQSRRPDSATNSLPGLVLAL